MFPTSILSLSNRELVNKLKIGNATTVTTAATAATTTTTTTTKATTTVQHEKTQQPPKKDDNTETYWRPLKYVDTLITNRTCLQHYTLLILVSSAPANSQRRNYIRKTWAFDRAFKPRWATVFLVAQSRIQNISNSLLKEDELYGDLVRADYYDHYWNQTLKIQMGFEWATRYCKFSFLLKVDDDVFVNSAKFLSFLSQSTTPREKLYMGVLFKGFQPHRKGKWKVTEEEYSATYYPDFCPGFAILFSHDTVVSLVETFPVLPYYRLDDVYVGMLANRTGIKLRHNNRFEPLVNPQNQCIPNPGTLVRHGFFGGDGTHGDCYIKMFDQASAQK